MEAESTGFQPVSAQGFLALKTELKMGLLWR